MIGFAKIGEYTVTLCFPPEKSPKYARNTVEIIDTTTVMEIDFILKEGLDNL